jgi:hypothetical protein
MTDLRSNLNGVRAYATSDAAELIKRSRYDYFCKPPQCSVCGEPSFGHATYTQQELGNLLKGYELQYDSQHGCPAGTFHTNSSLTMPCDEKAAPVPVRVDKR